MFGAALCLAACGDDDLEPERGDGGAQRDAATHDAASPEPDAAPPVLDAGAVEPDASTTHDGGSFRPAPTNVSFETATRLEPDQMAPLQDERSATQVDYYVFAGKAGEYMEMSTDRSTFSPDVVMSLYDADHDLLAQNDEGAVWPGQPIDARLVVRLPADGDYYIVIDDPYTPEQFFQGAFPLLYYHLRLHQLADGVAGVAIGQGASAQSVAFAHDDKTGYDYVTLVGELGDEPSLFDVDGLAAHALIGRVQLSGTTGNGSSAGVGALDISDADGNPLAHIDSNEDQTAFDPPVEAAGYHLSIAAAGELGDNPYYAIDFVMLDDNPREQDETHNGELDGAETLMLTGTTTRRGLLLVELPEADIDYYQVDATAGERIAVTCEGESGGSGVRGLIAELRDDTDQVLATGNETSTANLRIDGVPIDRTATYYVRLTSETPKADTGSIDPWARCAIIAGL